MEYTAPVVRGEGNKTRVLRTVHTPNGSCEDGSYYPFWKMMLVYAIVFLQMPTLRLTPLRTSPWCWISTHTHTITGS